MADFPKFIDTQIDSTWRRFEILFTDMKQDSTNPGRQSPGNTLAVSQITGMAIQVNTDHSTTPPTAHQLGDVARRRQLHPVAVRYRCAVAIRYRFTACQSQSVAESMTDSQCGSAGRT